MELFLAFPYETQTRHFPPIHHSFLFSVLSATIITVLQSPFLNQRQETIFIFTCMLKHKTSFDYVMIKRCGSILNDFSVNSSILSGGPHNNSHSLRRKGCVIGILNQRLCDQNKHSQGKVIAFHDRSFSLYPILERIDQNDLMAS